MFRSRALLGALLLAAPLVVVGIPAHAAAEGPVVVIWTPTPSLLIQAGRTVMVTGTATTGAEPVTEVEASTDGGTSWVTADGGANGWFHDITPTASGTFQVLVRALTATTTGEPASVTVHVEGPPPPPLAVTCECVFDMVERPLVQHNDTQAVELGLDIQADRDGYLTGVFIRRGAYTGGLTVRAYNSAGNLMTQVTAPPGTGVQRVMLSSPLPMLKWSGLRVSYYTPAGGYAASNNYFTGLLAKSPLRASKSYYRYGTGGGYPTQTHLASNYWIMPIFGFSR